MTSKRISALSQTKLANLLIARFMRQPIMSLGYAGWVNEALCIDKRLLARKGDM